MVTTPQNLILNVDDNQANLYTRTRALRKAGYEVIEAETGHEALELVSRHKPALVLLDVHLPDISGIEVCRKIRNNLEFASIFVLQISATSIEHADKILALDSGADAYLIEPVEPEELIANVRALLRLRQAERALHESQTYLKLALEAATMGVWSWELETGSAYWSPECYQIFGAKDVINTVDDVSNFINPEDVERVLQARKKAIDECGIYEVEYRIIRGDDGARRWVLSRGRCDCDKNKKPIRLTGVVTDVTRRKGIEEEREELLAREQALRNEAESANRLKDEFMAIVSHELRTPLNAIVGWANMLHTGILDENTTSRAVDTIRRSAKAQAKLIEDILDLSRINSGKLRAQLRPINLSSVITSAIDTMRPSANDKSIQIEIKYDSDVGPVLGDSERLQQVMLNLLSNSIKFTPAGGRITVYVERVGNNAQIKVEDTGKGIEPEFLPYIFDRFRQADSTNTRSQGGLGLGLSIAHHLITNVHRGSIEAHSEGVGKGATFLIKLLLMPAKNESDVSINTQGQPRETSNESNHKLLSGLNILVVDDHPDSLQMITQLLVSAEAEVQSASSAAEAFELFRQNKPDILISDLAMPNEDGYALIRRVREYEKDKGEHTPAIALTAHVMIKERIRTQAEGFQIFISKPVETNELIDAITNLINNNNTVSG